VVVYAMAAVIVGGTVASAVPGRGAALSERASEPLVRSVTSSADDVA
jgi:hypothetical protein